MQQLIHKRIYDAIHVATALNNHADFFITQDKCLQTTQGLQKITLIH
ncbi:MAG: hypothetical protein RIT27_114 [Pseudomonadota bacterium]|jgi:predicted nucleic acid-binding protein